MCIFTVKSLFVTANLYNPKSKRNKNQKLNFSAATFAHTMLQQLLKYILQKCKTIRGIDTNKN